MDKGSRTSDPIGRALLIGAGLLFAVYPAVRPYADDGTAAALAAFGSERWVLAHVSAMVGFVLMGLALYRIRTAAVAATLWALGAGLLLPYYGAEAFALNAVGRAGGEPDASLALVDEIRNRAVQMTMFGVGLVLVSVAAVVLAVTLWRSGAAGRWAGVPLALGFVAFIPQFYAAPWVRIADGVLIAVGVAVLAEGLRRAGRSSSPQSRSTITGAWSLAPLPLRSSRSIDAPVTRAASAGEAIAKSMRMPWRLGKRSCV